MSISTKLRRTLVVVVVAAVVASFGVFAAFTATTTNPGNSLTAGTVVISDNDGTDVAMYTAGADGDLAPGATVVRCIKVTYTGSLAAKVKLYVSSGVTNGTKWNLKVERGTQTTGAFPTCGNFSATSTAYDADLGAFGTDYTGGVDGKDAAGDWATNDYVAYRFTLTAKDDATANAHITPVSTGSHTFTWEARSN